MLEIVMNESERYILSKSGLFDKKNIIDFCLFLSYGKFDEDFYNSTRRINTQISKVKLELDRLNETLEKHNEVRIWYSSLNSEEMCNLYFLCGYIKNKKIYGCDITNDDVAMVSCYTKEEIKPLLVNTREINPNDYIDTWNKLFYENKDMRIFKDGNLISMDFKVLDNYIFNYLKQNGECKYHDLIVNCIVNRVLNLVGNIFFMERIDYLIEQGKIKITKYKKEKDLLGDTIIRKYIAINI